MDALTGKLLASRFQLFERLDDRGAALTYRGQDRRLGAACRVIVPKLEARAAFGSFERTWRQLGTLRCPHLAQMVDQGRLGAGRPYVVFRWIEGRTLDQIIRAEGPQTASRAVAIVRAALLALQEAHGNGIVHRDVIPANIVIGHGPDAGAIKLVGFAGAPRDAIDARAIPGDPYALAPERFVDPLVATPLSDLYAVGVLLYTLLAGRGPFDPADTDQGADVFERLRWLHAHAHPTRPNTGVPDALWRLTLGLLEKRPQDRPNGADRALAALDAAQGNRSIPPPFVTGESPVADPFQSTDSADALDALDSLDSTGGMDPFAPNDEPTVADRGPALDDAAIDAEDEPTVQQSGLAAAAALMFARGAGAGPDADPFAPSEAVDPFARTRPVEAPVRSADDALDSLVSKDPLAIEAEHDSVNSDIFDELTLPDRAQHLRAMMRPRPIDDAADDDQPTRRLGAAEPPAVSDSPLPPPQQGPPAAPPARASVVDDALTRPLPPHLRSAPVDEPRTRPSRPGNRARLLAQAASDPLAKVPDVSAFSDPAPDEVSTIVAPSDARRVAQVEQAAAPAPAEPRPARIDTGPTVHQTPRAPVNLPAQAQGRVVGIVIAVAALLALVGGLMWFTGGNQPEAAQAPVSSPATAPPIKIGN